MKRLFIMACAAIIALPLAAQETYENAKVATQDLNGTARYVGMGGAMDALGADISTISTNPAGIGLFRRSTFSGSLGLVSQADAGNRIGASATHMSFDQLGFVVAMPSETGNFLNFAFNYHKSRNFDQILSVADRLNNASQNKLTYAKQKNGLLFNTDANGVPDFNNPYNACNQIDDIYARNLNYDADQNAWFYDPATGYTFDREHWGYVADYDFNLSANLEDRVYLGMTVGIQDINYRHYSEYVENLDGPNGLYDMAVYDERRIDGTGVNVKAGAIIRPIEESPFRIGLSIATPTWYDMKTSNFTELSDGSVSASNGESYKFSLYTPWRFGLSIGHTIGSNIAIGAGYEFADYNTLDSRYNTDEYYDAWDGSYYTDSESDREMNRHTHLTLKGVSTLKAGIEYRPVEEFAVRFGYNYVSPMYKQGAFKDGTIDSAGSYYSSATDFVNWQATNRITCGLGFTTGKWNLDLAYQYNTQSGKFSPFMTYVDKEYEDEDNICDEVTVKNNRHQLLFTVGYRF